MFVNTADIYLYQWGGILMLSKLKYLVKGLHNVLYGQRMNHTTFTLGSSKYKFLRS